MKIRARVVVCAMCFGLAGATTAMPQPQFASALDDFARDMARRHGMDLKALTELLRAARFRNEIIDSITRPTEALPWHQYRKLFVNDDRARLGAEYWRSNGKILQRAEQTYGVPPEVIVAIVGVESRYGSTAGRYPVLDALVTLSFGYPRRSEFFRGELEQFLLLSREEKLDPLATRGSYAGAMGEPQFIASSYRRYAVDFDGDRRRDLLGSRADIIGSVANYLNEHGWEEGGRVAVAATVTSDAIVDGYGLEPRFTVAQLRRRGVQPLEKIDAEERATLVKLDGEQGDVYHVGFQNLYVITRYNHNVQYAMAVYELSQLIRDKYSKGKS